jgi:putative transposase
MLFPRRTTQPNPNSHSKWRKKYRGMDIQQARKLKELEKENQRLKEMVAEMALDNRILKAAAEGNL